MSITIVNLPSDKAITKKPKIIDFTDINLYPSKYKIVEGKAIIHSLIIENVDRQYESLKSKNTTVMIGDIIAVNFKFGHFKNNEWADHYIKGLYKVKKIMPIKDKEIRVIVEEILSTTST